MWRYKSKRYSLMSETRCAVISVEKRFRILRVLLREKGRDLLPRVLKIASALICLSILILLAVATFAAHRLSVPTRFPLANLAPGTLGPQVEEVQFSTRDAVIISGWFIPSMNTQAVILVHGKDANRTLELDRDPEDSVP